MYNFILIDDNKIDLMIANKVIQLSKLAVNEVHEFTNPQKALEFIKKYKSAHHTIILIDIQMPIMNGFAFMDVFETFKAPIKSRFTCMYLTSSSNDLDRTLAKKYPSIKNYLNKPFSTDNITTLLKTLNK